MPVQDHRQSPSHHRKLIERRSTLVNVDIDIEMNNNNISTKTVAVVVVAAGMLIFSHSIVH